MEKAIYKCDYCKKNPYYDENVGCVPEDMRGEYNHDSCPAYMKSNGRDEALNRLADKKYGIPYNAKILNIVNASEKVLFKDLCRVYHVPNTLINKMTTNDAVSSALEDHDTERLVKMMELIEPNAATIFAQPLEDIDYVYDLAGMVYGSSVHASGVIISEEPINMPMSNGACHANGHYCEELGYIKIDMLGLSNLDAIEQMQGLNIDWDDIPADAFKYVHEGALDFVFQFGSPVVDRMVHGVSEDKITVLNLSDVTSINRPGPLGINLNETWVKTQNGELEMVGETTAAVDELRALGALKV